MPNIIKHSLFVLVILFLTQTGAAQLCSGSLGDPVVFIDFGRGSSQVGPPLPSSVTNYTYFYQGCPNDGLYTIANSSSNCFNSSWHNIPEDHTPGDVNGYMMLVNASYTPGVFYLDTVRNLCGGTTYEFSAWMMSVLRSSACNFSGIMPNITFSIETVTGDTIQTYSTGNISNLGIPQWNQYGFFFTLPPGYSNLVLRLINNAPGGCGNDLALDDIAFRPCGPKADAAFANVSAINDSVYYCITDNKNITLTGSLQSGYNNPAIQWQQSTDSGKTWIDIPGATGPTYNRTYSVSGRFQFRITAAESGNIGIARCRVASNVLSIFIDAIPVPFAASNSPVCINMPLKLIARNGNEYQWTGPNGFTSAEAAPVITQAAINNSGKYYVLVTTKGGCSKLDSTTIIVSPLPIANAGADATICEGTGTMLQASGGVLYRWNSSTSLTDTSIANPIASPLITTTYVVSVANQYLCSSTDTVTVMVLKRPLANAGPDKKMNEGQSVILNGVAGGDTAFYFWTPAQFISNSSIMTPVVSPLSDFTYTFHVQSGNGCGVATDDVFVRVFKTIHIPNAFSPNGDGINDVWKIDKLETYPESETNVFNRYGQLVFHELGYNKPWDGRFNGNPLAVGTYYYTVDRKNGFPLMSGWILIVR